MKLLLTTAAFIGAAALPALAQEASGMDYATMTCADFLALDEAGMQEAMTAMQTAMESGGDEAAASTDTAAADAAGDAAATEETTTAEASGDAAATDDMAVTDTETTAATTDTAAADAGAAGEDPMMAAVRTSCEGAPDSLVMDAMMAAQADTSQ